MRLVGRPMVIAHRGASRAEPANTLAAFAAAVAQGADAVELDARRTADGLVVVHHDEALADGRALVDLARVELPAEVCDLAEAVATCGDLVVNIEIKNHPRDVDFDPDEQVADAVLALAGGHPAPERLLISSFHLATIDHVRARAPALATALLCARVEVTRALWVAIDHGHRILHPPDDDVTEGVVAAAHEAGAEVNVWTVDDPERMRELAQWGTDGIVTNVPDVALKALGP